MVHPINTFAPPSKKCFKIKYTPVITFLGRSILIKRMVAHKSYQSKLVFYLKLFMDFLITKTNFKNALYYLKFSPTMEQIICQAKYKK